MTNQTQTTSQLPTTWAAICALKSDLFAEAKQDAANNWDLRVIRSRGAVLVAEDAEGKTLLATGESWDMPKTLKGFKAALETIKGRFPTAARVLICIGCDSAESVRAMNDGDYTPWAGEATGLVYEYPESTQQPEQAAMTSEAKAAIQQMIETLSSSRKSLQARLTNWDETTALVGEQWIVCTPDAACAYKLTPIAPLGDGKKRYASECCSIVAAPLYSKEKGEEVLKYQVETRGGQSLVLMHIRDALVTDLNNVTGQENLARKALARLESRYTLTPLCPDRAIVHHSQEGDSDYSQHASKEAAWSAEQSESWVKETIAYNEWDDHATDKVKAVFMAALCEYSKDEILAAADEGCSWPEDLGFVEAKE